MEFKFFDGRSLRWQCLFNWHQQELLEDSIRCAQKKDDRHWGPQFDESKHEWWAGCAISFQSTTQLKWFEYFMKKQKKKMLSGFRSKREIHYNMLAQCQYKFLRFFCAPFTRIILFAIATKWHSSGIMHEPTIPPPIGLQTKYFLKHLQKCYFE